MCAKGQRRGQEIVQCAHGTESRKKGQLVYILRWLAGISSRRVTGSDSGCPVKDGVGELEQKQGRGVDPICLNPGNGLVACTSRHHQRCILFNLNN